MVSLIRTAFSTAYSSGRFILNALCPSSPIHRSDVSIRTGASTSGTCFMQTSMFVEHRLAVIDSIAGPHAVRVPGSGELLRFDPAETVRPNGRKGTVPIPFFGCCDDYHKAGPHIKGGPPSRRPAMSHGSDVRSRVPNALPWSAGRFRDRCPDLRSSTAVTCRSVV